MLLCLFVHVAVESGQGLDKVRLIAKTLKTLGLAGQSLWLGLAVLGLDPTSAQLSQGPGIHKKKPTGVYKKTPGLAQPIPARTAHGLAGQPWPGLVLVPQNLGNP